MDGITATVDPRQVLGSGLATPRGGESLHSAMSCSRCKVGYVGKTKMIMGGGLGTKSWKKERGKEETRRRSRSDEGQIMAPCTSGSSSRERHA